MIIDTSKRIKQIDKKYKPIIEKYNTYIEVLESMELDSDESIELSVSKAYILTNKTQDTVEIIRELGYTKPSTYNKTGVKKIILNDVMDILRDIPKYDENKYKRLAREQYKANGGIISSW